MYSEKVKILICRNENEGISNTKAAVLSGSLRF